MNQKGNQSKPACSHCGSNDIVLNARASVGDNRDNDVIRTEMIGCAIVFKYLTCNACGKNVTRAEYERFQEAKRNA